MTVTIRADEVPQLFQPGMHVYIQGYASEPVTILQALKNMPEASNGIHYISNVLPGLNQLDFTSLHKNASMTAFFLTRELKKSFLNEKVRFVPLHLTETYNYLNNEAQVDVAIIQVSPPNDWGYCSLGISADFVPAVLNKAKVIIAEMNDCMPCTHGEAPIHIDKLDYIVKTNRPLPEMPKTKYTPDMERIGKYVSTLVKDGDTIQFGIGAVPEAILSCLKDKKDLGIHSGLIIDTVVDLIEAGVVTGKKKTLDRGKIVTGIAVGTKRLYDFVNNNPLVDFRPVCYTHSINVLKQIDNFVSINSAIEIDLFGQINAETIRGAQFGGTGGQVDFIRGTRLSLNGKSIIALLSTADQGKISRIVPAHKSGTIITTTRTDVQFVVTEYGIADLRNKSLQERADLLISIAAPQFRGELESAWGEIKAKWKEWE
ncbi:acetyl-CoA hydrolase/transferase family protein [Aneurinibacillus danicus]|jgi:4-hydroxybutyrate CoA-transferase|uniref:4-hydroxybutyrate CoA-transferase n=1 Tax=Aneurinibacillus danicus TaxID=267746 RepID=A0A511V908_9BACL|nr:acetyl-CoA hydrolase/transferase C-terminal domain-containing protein [Aneurinibacillus danicus]GEN35437.1 4-hydroxybutyrate CoA-transferase [Aneurinibacillus danicus]